MSDGRTYWWACDAAWYDRERVADLVLMYGPTGAAALHWICCHAKALNDGGVVKTGYSAITKGIGGALPEVMEAVRYAAEIGALDDFEENGKRFTCRISGWQADQERAFKQARNARHRETLRDGRESPDNEDRDRTEREGLLSEASASPSVSPEVANLCNHLARVMIVADPKAKTAPDSAAWQRDMRLLLERDKRTVDEVAVVIDYIFDEGFWIPMVRSPAALRKRFDQIAAQSRRPAPVRRNAPWKPDHDKFAAAAAAYEARHANDVEKTAATGTSNPDEEAA